MYLNSLLNEGGHDAIVAQLIEVEANVSKSLLRIKRWRLDKFRNISILAKNGSVIVLTIIYSTKINMKRIGKLIWVSSGISQWVFSRYAISKKKKERTYYYM